MHRRHFLKLVGGAASACGSSAPRHDDTVVVPSGAAEVVRVTRDEFPMAGVVLRGAILLGHDERGAYAMTAVCTHEGCLVGPRPPSDGGRDAIASAALECPCHGACFGADGLVLRGPASSPLAHFVVRLEGDDVVIDPNVVVDASARTAL